MGNDKLPLSDALKRLAVNEEKFEGIVNGVEGHEEELGGKMTPSLRTIFAQLTSDAFLSECVQRACACAKHWALQANKIATEDAVIATGSTEARTLPDRFADVINVKDFGAKGDGVTDDTTAIQAAFDYSAQMSGEGKSFLVVAPGNYAISNQLRIHGKQDQRFNLGNILVKNWQGSEDAPAILVQAQRTDLYFSLLDCGRACPGVFLDTTGSVVNSGSTILHYKKYGLTWSMGGNVIYNPNIRQIDGLDDDFLDFSLRDAPGILVQGIDSKVIGGHIGWCGPGITFTEESSGNFFINTHIWTGGDADHLQQDATIIENYSNNNYMYDCYFDSGHIDMYAEGLKVVNGWALNNTEISNLTSPFVRYYSEKTTIPYTAKFENVAGCSFGFFDGSQSYAGDFTKINGLYNSSDEHSMTLAGYYNDVFRAKNKIIPRSTAGAVEYVYKPGGEISYEFWKADDGLKVTYEPNSVRFKNVNGEPGCRIYLGGGSPGIGEYSAGTLAFYAVGDVRWSLHDYSLYPIADNEQQLGGGTHRISQVFAASGSINTSDAREKQSIEPYPDDVLDAWGDVEFRQFFFNDSVGKKGADAARLHSGVIAQQVLEVFKKHGLDATRYGLFCYDKWGDEYGMVEVVDAPAVLDAEGNEVEPAQTHTERRLVMEAGDRYGIRYSEALCMEAAYQRRRADRLEARIAALEAKLK